MKVGFGGGCHWCTEGIYLQLRGVREVKQGWIRSNGDNSSFSEAVVVDFDEQQISLETLCHVHFLTHSSTVNHKLRDKYRSAIYFNSQDQVEALEIIRSAYNEANRVNLITKILCLEEFKINIEKYQNYYGKNHGSPFCERYIEPKLEIILLKYGENFFKT